jgi:hypothetical protein
MELTINIKEDETSFSDEHKTLKRIETGETASEIGIRLNRIMKKPQYKIKLSNKTKTCFDNAYEYYPEKTINLQIR